MSTIGGQGLATIGGPELQTWVAHGYWGGSGSGINVYRVVKVSLGPGKHTIDGTCPAESDTGVLTIHSSHDDRRQDSFISCDQDIGERDVLEIRCSDQSSVHLDFKYPGSVLLDCKAEQITTGGLV